jgi:ribonuclease HI
MKQLKFNHDLAELIRAGKKTVTFRMYDDKDLSVDDEVELLDKVVAAKPATWHAVGRAHIKTIVEKRLSTITDEELRDEHYDSREQMLKIYQKYYGDPVTLDTPVKVIRFEIINPGDSLSHGGDKYTTSSKDLSLFADGGSRGNPGPSAGGYAIIDDKGVVIVKRGIYLGVTTNNQAEYTALKLGLEELNKMGIREVHVYMDSLLVVNQMLGLFKIKNRDLWPIHDATKQLVATFDEVSFTHVPRTMNKIADAAVNEALDEAAKGSR